MITIPTIAQLYADILSDLEFQYGVNIPTFGKSVLRAIALVQAGKLKLYYLAIGNLQKNIFVDTAESESIGGTLQRFGRVKLNRNPFPAVAGQYDVTVTGVIGSVISSETTFKSNDDSASPDKMYVLDTSFTLVATTGTITIRALEGGIESKLAIGNQLTSTAPIIGLDSIVTVTAEPVPPLAAETLEEYRSKALDAYRLEPQGGAATDYRLWAEDAQGIKQSYPYAKSGAANEINVFVEATIANSTDGKGTPSTTLLNAVAAVIEFDPDITRPLKERGRRPLGVFDVHVLPITVRNVDISITGFVGLTTAIQNAIISALTNEINLVRPFVSACDVLENKNDILDTNKIISIILGVRPGSVFGTIALSVSGTPSASWTFQNGDIPYVNSITFV